MASIEFDNNASHFDIRKHIPITPYGVPLVIWDCIEKYWPQKSVEFTREYPRDTVHGPTITWSIYRKVPGRDGLESLGPRLRQFTKDKSDPYALYEEWAQWMTVIYEFEIFDTSHENVDLLAEEFEELMAHIKLNLMRLGVLVWIFDEQLKDENLNRKDTQTIYKRIFRYRCILQQRFIKAVPQIAEIWLQAVPDILTPVQDESITRSNGVCDVLANPWVATILAVTNAPQLSNNIITPTTDYVQHVDFSLDLKIPEGTASLKWTPNGKHPQTGQVFYISYLYRSDMGVLTSIA